MKDICDRTCKYMVYNTCSFWGLPLRLANCITRSQVAWNQRISNILVTFVLNVFHAKNKANNISLILALMIAAIAFV